MMSGASERWRDRYDGWRLASPEELDALEQDELDARAEDAAIERAEREREDAMFDEQEV